MLTPSESRHSQCSSGITPTKPKQIMGEHYITQKVMQAIEELIGEDTPENESRLVMASAKMRQGALPIHRETMSGETLQHLKILESEKEFFVVREAFIGYLLSTQRDVGRCEA
jgi:hypothetical protein